MDQRKSCSGRRCTATNRQRPWHLLIYSNFFAKHPDHTVTKTIREKLTLLVLPMLNPDGAERFTRRTAQLVDLNRDALVLETPEAKILKELCMKYKPEYGFNLHDQDTRLTVGTTKKITVIALLAPSTDESRSDNPVRLKAKKVASTCAQILNLFIRVNLQNGTIRLSRARSATIFRSGAHQHGVDRIRRMERRSL